MYQHEISIITEKDTEIFPLIAITNLDQVKTLHLAKGEVVGFAKPESLNVTYIATTNELNIEETVDVIPRNWIPKRKWNDQRHVLRQPQGNLSEYSDYSQEPLKAQDVTEIQTSYAMEKPMQPEFTVPSQHEYSEDSMDSPLGGAVRRKVTKDDQCEKPMMPMFQLQTCESSKALRNSLPEGAARNFSCLQHPVNGCAQICEAVEHSQDSMDQQWCDINEVIESDFLISPGDIYPNRKVQLEDADIKDTTRAAFDLLCEQQHEAFSKNNKDKGCTQLIEMEVDTGDSLPVAQSPYTLPLKHYNWVRQEIETLEKSRVIERSLSRWASPVIIVPKKSAPDKPPRRHLCVDYHKVNVLQQKVKWTDKSTSCLSLYPLLKIDEMFSKLGGTTVFSTIDLHSGYYHISLTRESRAKSAFVVPMGKWQFKQTPFRLSQAPAYFQLLIDKVLMGCSSFTMGYLDDIIIFSKSEEEHLHHLEEIFTRLHNFGLKMK